MITCRLADQMVAFGCDNSQYLTLYSEHPSQALFSFCLYWVTGLNNHRTRLHLNLGCV